MKIGGLLDLILGCVEQSWKIFDIYQSLRGNGLQVYFMSLQRCRVAVIIAGQRELVWFHVKMNKYVENIYE